MIYHGFTPFLSMISILVSTIIMLFTAAAIGIITDRRTEECIPLTFLGICFCLYVFYCLNLLVAGRIFVYLLMAVTIILAIKKQKEKKEGQNWLEKIFTPAVAAFLLFTIFFYIYTFNFKPAVWDELRLWSAMPKALHSSPVLQVGDGSLLYSTMQSYPPGMALLVYFITAFQKTYYECSPFFTTAVFGLALLMPAFQNISWRKWTLVLPSAILFLMIPVLLTINGDGASGDWAYYYLSLFIDPVLGFLFGYGIYLAVKVPFQNLFSALNFALCLFLLPALKNTGAMYGGIVFLVAILIAFAEKEQKNRIITWSIPAILLLAASYFSWQLIINTKGTGEFIDFNFGGITMEKISNVFSGITTWGKLPFLWIALFFLGTGIVMTLCLKDISKKSAWISGLGIFAATVIFFYGYTSHYGSMLSSVHRYTQTLTFGMFLFLFMRLLFYFGTHMEIKKTTGKIVIVAILEILLCIATVLVMGDYKKKQYANPEYKVIREQVESLSEHIDTEQMNDSPAKCYLLIGGDTLKQSQKHETFYQTSIGTKIDIKNIWCDKLINEAVQDSSPDAEEKTKIWAEELVESNYDYVLIIDPDEEIKNAVQQISPGVNAENDQILAIEKEKDHYPIKFRVVH